MPVILLVQKPQRGGYEYRIGYGDFVFCFFSSISYHLEGVGKWGSRFPRLLLDLCDHGIVAYEHIDELDKELGTIYRELQHIPVSTAIYDIENPDLPIPWEAIPGGEDMNLAQPWVTPRGETSYFEVFANQVKQARYEKAPMLLIFPPETGSRDTLWQRKKKGHDYWTKDKDPISLTQNQS